MENMRDFLKRQAGFAFMLLMMTVALFLRYYEGVVNEINTTMLAFSYRYGFISRGLVGWIYDILDRLLPFDLMNRWGVVRFTQLSWALYMAVLILFFLVMLRHVDREHDRHMKVFIIFYIIFAVPFFLSNFNFGRSDMWMLMMSLMAVICMMNVHTEWMAIVLCGLGVMVHQGYVFMFVNIVLVIMLYRALQQTNVWKNRYMLMFIITFAEVSVLFIYFEKFSHGGGYEIVDSIRAMAQSLVEPGKIYHKDVVDKEILGISLADREEIWRNMNHVQTPIFLVCMLPYLIIFFDFFRRLLSSSSDIRARARYMAVALGAVTMLPELILKCDYGRWTFAIISYYMIVVMTLMAMGDDNVGDAVSVIMSRVNGTGGIGVLLMAYPLVFQPLGDVAICGFVSGLADRLQLLVGANWW